MIGVEQEESLNAPLRSNTGDYINIFPSMFKTKFLISETNFYSLRIL
jgi:hypothetical protein